MPKVTCRAVVAVGLVVGAASLTGCTLQRASVAADAKVKMVGMERERVLACMGPPSNKMAEGGTEVWAYESGDGTTVGAGSAVANRFGNTAFGSGFGIASRRFCNVNVVMQSGRVQAVNYSGPTGPLLAQGEQCAYAVQNCVGQ